MKQRLQIRDMIRVLPVMAAIAFVPLIVTVKQYETGLAEYEWFSNVSQSVDLFLYWKGRALILLAVVRLASAFAW